MRTAAVALLFLGACSAGDESGQSERSTASREAVGEAWDVGADAGEHFGPFPDIFGSPPRAKGGAAATGWVAVVIPPADPLDAFNAVIEDATSRGFTAHMRDGGACWQQWSREEVPFGEDGEGDGYDFGGDTPFGADLPVGARVTGVSCKAAIARAGDSLDVSMRAGMEPLAADLPARSAVILRTRNGELPANAYRQGELDVELPAAPADFTDRELSRSVVDVPGSAVEGLFYLPPGDGRGCSAVLIRAPGAPVDAAAQAIAAQRFGASFQAAPEPTSAAGQDAATAAQAIPADGPTVYVAAVAAGTESEVLICSASS